MTSWKPERSPRGSAPNPANGGLDPRVYQISILAVLLVYGVTILNFEVEPLNAIVILVTVLGVQWICTRFWGLPFYDPKSALISGLSLCLLLRTHSLLFAFVAAVLAIAPKFLVRWKGKHLYNPTNGAIIFLILAGAPIWVSPGQWGNVAFFAFLMACLGGLVVNRAARSDVTYAFIFFYCLFVFYRSWNIGEPFAIPFHRLESGSLLLFTFFMISDPKTTPDSRRGRILFAALVAYGAFYVQFRLFRTNGPLWSLAFFSTLVPVIDRLLPGVRYDWKKPAALPAPEPGGPVLQPAVSLRVQNT